MTSIVARVGFPRSSLEKSKTGGAFNFASVRTSGDENSSRSSVEDDPAVRHCHAAIRVLSHQAHVVRDERHRSASIGKATHVVHESSRLAPVLPEGGLVQNDDLWLGDHHAGDGQPSLLPVTQQEGTRVLTLVQANRPQDLVDPLFHLVRRYLQRLEPVGHLLVDRLTDELLLGYLKDVGHPPGEIGELIIAGALSIHNHRA